MRRLGDAIAGYKRHEAADDDSTALPSPLWFSTLWKSLQQFLHTMDNTLPRYGKSR